MALTEWIVWRFDGLHGRTQPAAFLEAAWCATADPRYMRFFEAPRADWMGPVEGPLWCAMTRLRHALAKGVGFPRDLDDGLSYLARLAAYVQPTRTPDRDAGRRFLQGMLDTARQERIPFLATPDELRDARFTGTPYVLR